MNLIVVDFEWNQAMSSKSSVFNHLPIHLNGEIIEIGATKINSDLTLGEEYTVDIKPLYFRKIHHQVKKITGFDKERLENGISFPEALGQFHAWCGDNVTFLTWGSDDQGIFEQNIIVHDLDWDWVSDWINLQRIYNVQTGGDKNQKSLATAMEYFQIEQTRVAHDALGDAYNTALVALKLDLKEGILHYDDALNILSERTAVTALKEEGGSSNGSELISREIFSSFPSKAAALAAPCLSAIPCPVCSAAMSMLKWINQGDQRYINLVSCSIHGDYLARARFRKTDNITWAVSRSLYEADEDARAGYRAKAAQSRHRGRNHTRHVLHTTKVDL